MKMFEKSVIFLSTGFYSGKIPLAPGTFGTLPALPLCYMLSLVRPAAALVFIFVFIALAVMLAHRAERLLKQKDPGCIVIDEMAGMMVTLAGLPFNGFTMVAGFVVFRVLDIFKPFPIRFLERRVAGGLGIVIDDVAAGIIGNVTLRILLYIIEM